MAEWTDARVWSTTDDGASGSWSWSSDDSDSAGSKACESFRIPTELATAGHSQDFGAAPTAGDRLHHRSPHEKERPRNDVAVSADDQEVYVNPAAASHEFNRQASPPMAASSATGLATELVAQQYYISAGPMAAQAALLPTRQTMLIEDPAAVPATITAPASMPAAAVAWPLTGPSEPPRVPHTGEHDLHWQSQSAPVPFDEQHLPSRRHLAASNNAAVWPVTTRDKSQVDPVCPFCTLDPPKGKTRRRRMLKRERQRPKFGNWWKQDGYRGPTYCQRCSEVFRDHIMRQKPNSASCSRDAPCDDCTQVLRHFNKSGQVLWDVFDRRAMSNSAKAVEKRKQQHLADRSVAQPPVQRAKRASLE